MTTHIIIIRETVAESIISDAVTFAMFACMIGLGVWLDSSAMQWVGALVFFISMMSRATLGKGRMTIAQARMRLDEIENAEVTP